MEQIAFNVFSVAKLVQSGFRVVKMLINSSVLGIVLCMFMCFCLGCVCPDYGDVSSLILFGLEPTLKNVCFVSG